MISDGFKTREIGGELEWILTSICGKELLNPLTITSAEGYTLTYMSGDDYDTSPLRCIIEGMDEYFLKNDCVIHEYLQIFSQKRIVYFYIITDNDSIFKQVIGDISTIIGDISDAIPLFNNTLKIYEVEENEKNLNQFVDTPIPNNQHAPVKFKDIVAILGELNFSYLKWDEKEQFLKVKF